MSLENIRLQDKAVEFLKISLRQDRLHHSLLFLGPKAVGKGLTAMTLAKALNCEVAGPLDCCDRCPSCRKIDNLNHPDLYWIGPEGAGNIVRIERIRNMKERIFLKPFEGRAKFFIIDGAHLLNDESANSILKTLEEPPKNSVIILITDDLNKVFSTLKSRCQWVVFQSAKPETLKRLLMDEYGLEETQAHFLSHLSEGRIGKALVMKDEGTLEWRNKVLDRFSKENIISKEDPFFFSSSRKEILNQIDILINWYRDIFILKTSRDSSLLVNIDRLEDLNEKADFLPEEKIKEILDEALKMREYVEHNVNPKLALSNLACVIE